ncbi:RNA-directed DNA polymerase, eukaryota [Tanacetum coccineum]
MGDRRSFNSKEDLTKKISKSVFVMNFLDHFSSRDLWNVCTAYGNVIDVYIPLKKSKAGKKFAFVHFLKVENLDRLIGNLCTIWIGRLCLHANPVRFQREIRASTVQATKKNEGFVSNSFASVLKSANEGFEHVNLTYLGGFWVLLDTGSTASKEKLCKHMGVASWFNQLIPADDSFVSEDRLVWISVEGLPIKAWSHNTFAKIVSLWGLLFEVEAEEDLSLPYKKLCVITKPHILINNKLKIIVKGQVYWIRIKELEAWYPDFSNYSSDNSSTDVESVDAEGDHINGKKGNSCEVDSETETDHVSESSCMKENDAAYENHDSCHDKKDKSEDPFGIYDILNRKKDNIDSKGDDPIFPPGFTPNDVKETVGETNRDSINHPNMNKEGNSSAKSGSNRVLKIKLGGFIFEVMEGLVEIGQTMSFKMNLLSLNVQGLGQSAKKNWIQELNRKHYVNFVAIQGTKMENIDLFSIKALWGNFSFDFAFSPSVGSSEGILCV